MPRDTHIPERADLAVAAQYAAVVPQPRQAWPARVTGEPPLRPLRLFARPEFIDVMAEFPHGPPATFRWRREIRKLVQVEGPERIACEWWMLEVEPPVALNDIWMPPFAQQDGAKIIPSVDGRALTRDYFRGEDKEGLRYWIYREGIQEREVVIFRWFLHGLFA